MRKIAVYGKGGIGKSTIVSNLSAILAKKGFRVMQIGCDPKADSTINLHGGKRVESILELVREKKNDFKLEEMLAFGYKGVMCVEAGGPIPGLGCAGRGIITALSKLEEKGAYEEYKPDVVFYDVLGDVVCGGFSTPMRQGYADYVLIITSGENMSLYAAENIAQAIKNFDGRGYAKLSGVILNSRDVKNEIQKVEKFVEDNCTNIIGILPRSELVQEAEELHKTVIEAFPQSNMAHIYEKIADEILGGTKC